MSHLISLSEAIAMTSLYRQEREGILMSNYRNQNILPIAECFSRGAFDTVLAQSGCAGLRIYYGMAEDLQVHAIIVATDASGHDLLPGSNQLTNEEEDIIIERGNRCPEICDSGSPLNS
jgi:hypothetical protein